jgi:xanthine dehydrogenase small subunit
MSHRGTTQFILNADLVEADVPPGLSVLDYLRDHQRLTGTKEGCRVGDCGACNVLVGELAGGRLSYQPMTACLVPVGELNGKHLVTIEGLNHGQLTTVQAMLRDCGASQCGYCTPGFVMSLTAWILDPSRSLDADGLEDAISGNLCRCTGYRPIKQAATQVAEQLRSCDLKGDRTQLLCRQFGLPEYFMDIEKRLQQLSVSSSHVAPEDMENTIVAGATDLYLQQDKDLHEMPAHFLQRPAGYEPVQVVEGEIFIDAGMTFEELFSNQVIKKLLPDIHRYRKQIASWPVRCRATLGGNLCNASPVADLACLMLALEAGIELAGSKGRRCMPLSEFYSGYKQLNKSPDEIITTIRIPVPLENTRTNWIKVSKRFSLDIATLCSAMKIEHDGKRIERACLVIGGVAEIPLCMEKESHFLEGRDISLQTALAVAAMAQDGISPISDVRGSAAYRRLLVRQMIIVHFLQLFPEYLDEASLYEALR